MFTTTIRLDTKENKKHTYRIRWTWKGKITVSRYIGMYNN